MKGSKLSSKHGGLEVDKIEPYYKKQNKNNFLIGVSAFYSNLNVSKMSKISEDLSNYLFKEENDYCYYVVDAHDIKGKKIGGKKSVLVRGRYNGRRTEVFITPEVTPMTVKRKLPKTISGFCDDGRRRENVSINYKNFERTEMKKPHVKDLLTKTKNKYDVEVRIIEPTCYDLIQRPLVMGTLLSNAELMPPGKRYAMTLEALLRERQKEVTWNDLGGYKNLKTELMTRLGGPIINPDLFEGLNLKPSSILLTGPPGTGKTLMSNILVNELDGCCRIPFKPDLLPYSFSEKARTSQFFEFLDNVAEDSGQFVYLFYDEFEDIGNRFEGNRSQVINEVLRALDGSEDHSFRIVGTSNKPEEIDPAMFRPGRIHPIYYLPPPNDKERLEILDIYARKEPNYEKFDVDELAKMTSGYTGAHLKDVFAGAKIDDIVRVQLKGDKELKKIRKEEIILTQEKIKKYIQKRGPSIREETGAWNSSFSNLQKKLMKGSVVDASNSMIV